MSSGLLLLTALVLAVTHALPSGGDTHNHSHGLVGARKLVTSNDCASVVAFAGIGARALDSTSKPLAFASSLTDKGVGWSKDSGEFTCHCPGLYQFAFAGTNKVTLKKQNADSEEWKSVVSTGSKGGSNTVLLDMEIKDKVAIFLEDTKDAKEQEDAPTFSFNGYRIAKK